MSTITMFSSIITRQDKAEAVKLNTVTFKDLKPENLTIVYDSRDLDSMLVAGFAMYENKYAQIMDFHEYQPLVPQVQGVLFVGRMPSKEMLAKMGDMTKINLVALLTYKSNHATCQKLQKELQAQYPKLSVEIKDPTSSNREGFYPKESSTLLFHWMDQRHGLDNTATNVIMMPCVNFISQSKMTTKIPPNGYKEYYQTQIKNLARFHHVRENMAWLVQAGEQAAGSEDFFKDYDTDKAIRQYMMHYSKVRYAIQHGLRNRSLRAGRQTRLVKVVPLGGAHFLDYLHQLQHHEEDVVAYEDKSHNRIWYVPAGNTSDWEFFKTAFKAQSMVDHGCYWEVVTELNDQS